jgi:hypothetical protein
MIHVSDFCLPEDHFTLPIKYTVISQHLATQYQISTLR